MGTTGSRSSPTAPDGVCPLSAAQLLLVSPQAYVSLLDLFPLEGHPDDVQALTLDPRQHQLLLLPDNSVCLLQKSPPSIRLFEPKTCRWVPVKDYR